MYYLFLCLVLLFHLTGSFFKGFRKNMPTPLINQNMNAQTAQAMQCFHNNSKKNFWFLAHHYLCTNFLQHSNPTIIRIFVDVYVQIRRILTISKWNGHKKLYRFCKKKKNAQNFEQKFWCQTISSLGDFWILVYSGFT